MNQDNQKYSRMDKYHNSNQDPKRPKESKQYFFFKKVLPIIVVVIILIFALYKIIPMGAKHDQHSVHESASTEKVKSVEDSSESLSTESSSEEFSSTSVDDSITQSTNSDSNATAQSQQASEPVNSQTTFNNLQDAVNYGKQCVNNNTANNFRVINNNGKYEVQLY